MVKTVPLDGLLAPGMRIAQEIGVSVYDALYLALADNRGDTLLTWDKRLLARAKGTRFESVAVALRP